MDYEKKDSHKFTIQFNIADPQHKKTIDILNTHGRRKGQFIVNAVLHYINSAELPNNGIFDYDFLENIVLKIIQEKSFPEKNESKQANSKLTNGNITFVSKNTNKNFEDDTLKNMVSSINDFRNNKE
jgi:hypothetical protein